MLGSRESAIERALSERLERERVLREWPARERALSESLERERALIETSITAQ